MLYYKENKTDLEKSQLFLFFETEKKSTYLEMRTYNIVWFDILKFVCLEFYSLISYYKSMSVMTSLVWFYMNKQKKQRYRRMRHILVSPRISTSLFSFLCNQCLAFIIFYYETWSDLTYESLTC